MNVLKAEDAVYGGYVISRDEGVVFIRGAIPGELVEVTIKEKKRDYAIAEVSNIIEPSEHRIEPPCPYYGECGGCQIQFVSYDMQVQMKDSVMRDCLRRIAKLDIELAPHLIGRDFKYRRRAQFKVSKDGSLGFYQDGTHDVIAISRCLLMTDEINDMIRKLRAMDLAGIKEIHVTHGDSLAVLIKGLLFNEAVAEKFMAAGFTTVGFDDGNYSGQGAVTLDLNGLAYTVSPWSFLQSNWDLNLKVVQMISAHLEKIETKRVLDLYAGAGNFSLPLAATSSGVVAVEESPHSIKDGQRNIELNKIRKFKFTMGRAETARLKGEFDTVIVDPPRSGLTKGARKRLLEISPERIVYVSCNPSTFARDLKVLKDYYEIESIRMIDMFPHTYHLESLAFLIKKPAAPEPEAEEKQ